MPIQAIVRDIQFATTEPFNMKILFVKTPVLNLVPFLRPTQKFFSLLCPEVIGIIQRAIIHFLVLLTVDMRLFGNCSGHGIGFYIGHL